MVPNNMASNIGVWNSLKRLILTDKVNTIGDSAFSGCSGLTSIELPSSVTTIGHVAFRGCTGITSIEFPVL